MTSKDGRRHAIAEAIRARRPKTQHELVGMLRAAGHEATQATVSRDMTEMGIVKGPEGYLLSDESRLVRLLADLLVSAERAGNLVVLRSLAGGAQGVAAAIDSVSLGGVLGTIAGDDTILVITRSESEATEFLEQLELYRTM